MKRMGSSALAIVLALLLTATMFAMAESIDIELPLGESGYVIDVPAHFLSGELSPSDLEEGQIGYLYSEQTPLDFDLYQIVKDGQPEDLADFVNERAANTEVVTELVTDDAVNGIPAAWYRTVKEFEEAEYETLTYVLDGGEDYIVIEFWLDGDAAEGEAAAIICTLRAGE